MCSSPQRHQTGGSLLVGGCCSNGTPYATRHRGSQWGQWGEHKTGLGVRQQALQLGVPGAEWAAPGHDTRQASFTNLGGRAVLWGACPYLAHLPPGVPMLADQQNFPAKTLKLAIFGPRQNLTNAGGGRKCPTPPACPQHPPCGGGVTFLAKKKKTSPEAKDLSTGELWRAFVSAFKKDQSATQPSRSSLPGHLENTRPKKNQQWGVWVNEQTAHDPWHTNAGKENVDAKPGS